MHLHELHFHYRAPSAIHIAGQVFLSGSSNTGILHSVKSGLMQGLMARPRSKDSERFSDTGFCFGPVATLGIKLHQNSGRMGELAPEPLLILMGQI